MATKKEENKEEAKVKKDTPNKKIATGNTKKVVEKRSSSTTNKQKITKKTTTSNKQKQTTKNTRNNKTGSNKTTNNKTKVANSTKKNNTKKDEKVVTEKNNKQEVKPEQPKEKKSKIKHTEVSKVELEKIKTVLETEVKKRKKLPKDEEKRINKIVFTNIFLAIVVMLYFDFIILGFMNIESNVFLTDLKVFSMLILGIAIAIFEYAYKKDSGKHAIYGIEILVLALVTIGFIYLNIMYKTKFIPITATIAYIFSIYYIAKAIIIYKKNKKRYFINNMKEIIEKKED